MTQTTLTVAGTRLVLPIRERLRLQRQYSRLESPLVAQVPPRGSASLHASFWIVPRRARPGQDFRAKLVLTDQFENRRRLRVRFSAPRQAPAPPEREREQLSALTDPVEKGVASVLQAELARYSTNGRREGGFGSVLVTRSGATAPIAGGGIRTVGSSENQVIVADPENTAVGSDNFEALLALYEGLDEGGQERFRGALLSRVRRDSIYAPIAYLAMLVALRLNFAQRFFETARAELLGDEDYGFSNCLLLLDGLLRLDYRSFSEAMLDEIETFAHGTTEHPFAIPERIAAIRAKRLSPQRPGETPGR